MRAVVVEIKDNKAAVLSDDGRVIAISNNAYMVGQVIEMKKSHLSLTRKLVAYGAAAAAVVVLGFGSWAYASPYTYVSVDVNPSIEYSANRFDRVLSVKGVNDDGEEIIEKINLKDLKYQSIEKAVIETMEQITAAGYFTEDIESGVVITTASESNEKAEELAVSLQHAVEEDVIRTDEDVIVEAYSVGLERVEEAKQLGVTPGKLNLVEKLQASATDPTSVDIEQWLDRPVKDIMKATKDNKKATDASEPAITNKENASDSNKINSQTKEERKEQKQEQNEEKAQDKTEKKADVITDESSEDNNKKNQLNKENEDKIKEDKVKEDKVKEDKVKEDKVKENTVKENSIKENSAKENSTKEKAKEQKTNTNNGNSYNRNIKPVEKKDQEKPSEQVKQKQENVSPSVSNSGNEKKSKDDAITRESNDTTENRKPVETKDNGTTNTENIQNQDRKESAAEIAASDNASTLQENVTNDSNQNSNDSSNNANTSNQADDPSNNNTTDNQSEKGNLSSGKSEDHK